MRGSKIAFRIVADIPTDIDLFECPGIDGRTILEWTLKKKVSIRGIGLIQLRMGLLESHCECSIEQLVP